MMYKYNLCEQSLFLESSLVQYQFLFFLLSHSLSFSLFLKQAPLQPHNILVVSIEKAFKKHSTKDLGEIALLIIYSLNKVKSVFEMQSQSPR